MTYTTNFIKQHIRSICPKIDNSKSIYTCPYCKYNMLPNQRLCSEHIYFHKNVMQAIDKYGFYYNEDESERMKHPLRRLVEDTTKSYLVREKALLGVLKSYFCRAIRYNGIDNCPSFEDYIAMTLYNDDWFFPCRNLKKDDPLWINMVTKYGTKPGLKHGCSYVFEEN